MYYFKLAIGAIVLSATWIAFVFIGGFFGWWMSPIADTGDTEGFFRKATEILEERNTGNAAFVLIENGAIAGEYYSIAKDAINSDSIFSTASMSKWLTANAVMKLVQDRKVDLDSPVSHYLSRWELPPSGYDNDQVTIRRLLSHTAGIDDGLGFGDYAANEDLPSLEESLTNPRASSGQAVEIRVTTEPGTQFNYSGGSFLILELLIEEVSGMTFEQFMQKEFFEPLQMSRSTYDYIGYLENNAGSYDRSGEPAPLYKYASSAATGFATSAADLAKFVLAQTPDSVSDGVLQRDTLASMRVGHGRTSGIDIWGLGTSLYAPTPSGDYVYGHDGGNDPAINSSARINPDNGDAFILLETGHLSLATDIGSEWVLWQTGIPDFLSVDAVIESMLLPGAMGLALLLFALFYLGLNHYRRLRN